MPASPVRRALVQALQAKPHEEHRPALMVLAGDQWSRDSQHYGRDSDDYPIAQAAIAALADVAPLPQPDADRLMAIATDTSDPDVRRAGFALLVRTGGGAAQAKLFALGIEPGSARVRSSAAHALLLVGSELEERLIRLITSQLLARLYEPVAGVLAVLLGWRGVRDDIIAAAEALATNRKRRALLLLIAWALHDRDRPTAEEVVAMLPASRTVAWALGADIGEVDDAAISDLGDPLVCAEVLSYMKLRSEGSGARSKGQRGKRSGSARA